jgi:hypothetical protein
LWNGTTHYMPGATVLRNGVMYVATAQSTWVWNENAPPEWTSNLWSVTSCGATAAAPPPPPAAACFSTVWTQGQWYAAGSVVSYNGGLYKAKYANPGYNPTISTYYWSWYSC